MHKSAIVLIEYEAHHGVMIASAMGWIGTLGTIGAYVMLSRGLWTVSSLRYGAINLLGGVLGGLGSAAYHAWPSVFANVVWGGVALHSIVITLHARRRSAITLAPEPQREPEPEPVAYVEPDPWPDTLQMPALTAA